jgi:hypothetical protein
MTFRVASWMRCRSCGENSESFKPGLVMDFIFSDIVLLLEKGDACFGGSVKSTGYRRCLL